MPSQKEKKSKCMEGNKKKKVIHMVDIYFL